MLSILNGKRKAGFHLLRSCIYTGVQQAEENDETVQGWVLLKFQGKWSGYQLYGCAICGGECGYCVTKPLTSKSQMVCIESYSVMFTTHQTQH